MSYEPTNWQSGDVVTSAKLNKIEQGIADSAFLEKVQTIPAISGDYTVMNTPLGDEGSEYACTIENWCVLQQVMLGLGGAFTVTVTYENGEGETDVDVAEITTHYDDGTGIKTLNQDYINPLFVDEGEAGTLAVVAVPISTNDGYVRTDLLVKPRRPQQDSVAHIEITPVDLVGTPQSLADAIRIAGF